jgi:hypothetical protein
MGQKPLTIGSDQDVRLGTASDPWTNWTHYHNYSEIVATLTYLNATYPHIVDMFPIGESWQNRTIYCVRLTNESQLLEKPKVLFVGYHHAREFITAELALYFLVDAATTYGVNATITAMLNGCELFVIVALNVDGFEAAAANEWQRKNLQPTDEDGDGPFDEDPPDDADGDGYIENLFSWDGGNYEFIRWEGLDDDSDGRLNEDWLGGVDLNRNYGYQWNATCDSGSDDPNAEDYRGTHAFSAPETQALRDLALQTDFDYAISYHSGIELIIFPWAYTTTPSPDHSRFVEVASDLAGLVGCPYGQMGLGGTTSGIWDDWMYGNRSTLALTAEIYGNDSAWQYEPGPQPGTYWEKGVFEFFNPHPSNIEVVVTRWLPTFTYVTNRAIAEAAGIPGDVNGDRTVDIFDCVIVALAFGAEPGDAHWNPSADVFTDGLIDIFDITIVALHFGETAP